VTKGKKVTKFGDVWMPIRHEEMTADREEHFVFLMKYFTHTWRNYFDPTGVSSGAFIGP
jgi:hypothetical protein